jgi:hypothetical protein
MILAKNSEKKGFFIYNINKIKKKGLSYKSLEEFDISLSLLGV